MDAVNDLRIDDGHDDSVFARAGAAMLSHRGKARGTGQRRRLMVVRGAQQKVPAYNRRRLLYVRIMSNPFRLVSFCATSGLILAVSLRATAAAGPTPQPQTRLPESPQTALYVRVCAHCHSLERIESRHRTRTEWSDTIQQMIDDGADASDEEFETITDVLVRNFGAVAINRATSSDLVTVLGITAKDADAIVAYRAANGPFTTFEALRKVPGVDVGALETHQASIRY
jgi:competence ComEA-like helix-hairpin-helix protein